MGWGFGRPFVWLRWGICESFFFPAFFLLGFLVYGRGYGGWDGMGLTGMGLSGMEMSGMRLSGKGANLFVWFRAKEAVEKLTGEKVTAKH